MGNTIAINFDKLSSEDVNNQYKAQLYVNNFKDNAIEIQFYDIKDTHGRNEEVFYTRTYDLSNITLHTLKRFIRNDNDLTKLINCIITENEEDYITELQNIIENLYKYKYVTSKNVKLYQSVILKLYIELLNFKEHCKNFNDYRTW